jgi:16S rRNA (uracil1498-N3)-methyltransferase
MRLHRFYISEKVGPQTEIIVHSAELVNQVRKVFRLKTGDSIIVFDGSGSDYECRIADMGKESITLDIQNASRSRSMPSRNVYLYAAMVKKDTFEWIAEKATELGVTHIIPVMAERSEKKNINEARLAKIVVEASEQSGRGNVPTILPMVSLQEGIEIGDSNEPETLSSKLETLLVRRSLGEGGNKFKAL